ncbi:FirrV-1-A14 [Feldmannia irregularis virus a]|uniref:FirrV-1-A14 n=1 Tax=Feldmannia irregularis virus a TaxID=231992 RepID=Q6XM73_9PHYC|nr:FirrV-1-A14 [Feldmannia irregularis virus a]AAR26838.1 FirrV-1-A14 [Feldmannia irregularis virus a]
MECPRVSILTPTMASRARFAPLALRNIVSQTYPASRIEWVVVGDADRTARKVFESLESPESPELRYFEYSGSDTSIGAKRNYACSVATSKILVNVDDDDLYHPRYVENAVRELRGRKVNLVGCRDMMVYFFDDGKLIYVRGSHVHEATIVCTKQHWTQFPYRCETDRGEARPLLQGSFYNELDISQTMICLAHGHNTVDKSGLKLECTEIPVSPRVRRVLDDTQALVSD